MGSPWDFLGGLDFSTHRFSSSNHWPKYLNFFFFSRIFFKVKSRSAHMKSHAEAEKKAAALRQREAEQRAAAAMLAAQQNGAMGDQGKSRRASSDDSSEEEEDADDEDWH